MRCSEIINFNYRKNPMVFKDDLDKICISILMLISISFILVFTGEFIIKEEPSLVLKWINENRNSVLLNMIVIVICIVILSAITNSMGIATLIVGLIYQVLCIVTYYKYSINGQHLILNDFNLVNEGLKIVQDFPITFKLHILWNISVLLWITLSLFFFKWKLSNIKSQDFINKLLESDVHIYTHTINDRKQAQKYFDMGIYGVYTDVLTNNN